MVVRHGRLGMAGVGGRWDSVGGGPGNVDETEDGWTRNELGTVQAIRLGGGRWESMGDDAVVEKEYGLEGTYKPHKMNSRKQSKCAGDTR